MSAEQRAKMGQVAVDAARAVDTGVQGQLSFCLI